jgi:hypothetical protein
VPLKTAALQTKTYALNKLLKLLGKPMLPPLGAIKAKVIPMIGIARILELKRLSYVIISVSNSIIEVDRNTTLTVHLQDEVAFYEEGSP